MVAVAAAAAAAPVAAPVVVVAVATHGGGHHLHHRQLQCHMHNRPKGRKTMWMMVLLMTMSQHQLH
jgi:hypothetical protein